jgi:uncharacterized protein YceK
MRWLLLVISILIVSGCATISSVPPGYDLDLTPDNNGEEWR